jgi:hypothetical protein
LRRRIDQFCSAALADCKFDRALGAPKSVV